MNKPIETPITGENPDFKEGSPEAALNQFYRAFNGRSVSGVSTNWKTTPEIAMDNPLGGIMRGWEAIAGVYDRLFNGKANVYVEFHDYTILDLGNAFVAVGRERGTLKKDGVTLNLAIRTSRIYARVDNEWKQVHHHGSMDDSELLRQYQSLVRG